MNEYNVKVNFEKGMIQTNLKELVRYDYNSTKLNFTFDKEGRVSFKMLRPDNSQYVDEIENNTLIFGPGILSEVGKYEYEISLYTEDGRLTDYAIKSFEVRDELVNTDEIVEVDDRVPILDKLINEVNQINNIDIDIEDSVITLKRKDGTTKSENVKGDSYIITKEDKEEIETNIKEEIQPIVDEAKEKSETAISISKGANQSLGYSNYETMITAFNNLPVDAYSTGQSIYIVTLNVPDLWISFIEEENEPYTYVDDDTFVNVLKTNGKVKVGHYVLSQLETQKVDLTNYVTSDDFGSTSKAGVIKVSTAYGSFVRSNGVLQVVCATNDDIDERSSSFKGIPPTRLDYAIVSGLTNNSIELTDEQKTKIKNWLGI